ncbi:MAG: ribonuclease E/G, partial [Verrucomicrobiia bacterium]
MADHNFSRRRRGGQRFRPGKGQSFKPDRAALEARAEALGEKPYSEEAVFDSRRHEREILQAENLAAGLPGSPTPSPTSAQEPETPLERKGDFRPPHLDTPERVVEEPEQETVPQNPPPQGLVGSLRAAAEKVISRVNRLLRPKKQIHKEVIINAESLETRVAVLEEGRLEEFTIERTSDDRLVGSIFKGKVRNLEDGLKAAFVDIGFEKNAFLHYWDIVPSGFDSSVELVERENRKQREKPRITHKDIPRLYPPGSEIVVQVTKGPIGTKGPRVTTNLALPGRFLVLLPNSDQCGISRKIQDHHERQRLKKIVRKLTLPEGMGVIIRTAGEGQKARYFVRDLALLLEEWRAVQEKIATLPAPVCVYQ